MKRHISIILGFLLTANLFVLDTASGKTQPSSRTQQQTEQTEPEKPSNSIAAQDKEDDNEDLFYQEIEKHDLLDLFLWLVVIASLVSGAFGGFVYHLINFKEIQKILEEEAKRQGKEIDPKAKQACCASHVFIGAAAAPATILLLRPESAFAFIAMSVVAGSAGSAVFRNIQDKIMANVAVAQAVEKEKHDKTKSEHHARKSVALRLNTEQRRMLDELVEILGKPELDQCDWTTVRTIAKKLQKLCHECRETLESSVNGTEHPKDERGKSTPDDTHPPVTVLTSSQNGSVSP